MKHKHYAGNKPSALASTQAHRVETLEDAANLQEEVRKLSARLRESESGKSVFLSNVRNEINNPLASIIGLATSINGLTAEEKVKKLSALIQKQATQLDFQMRNIIIAAEIEMGEVRPCASRVNIVSLIESQLGYFSHTLTENNIDIELDLPDHVKFRTDAHLLQTIILNLLANAIEFCGARKKITLSVSQKTTSLEITVRDFGIGMDVRIQQELFQRFKQGDSGFCKSHHGQGLGLSIIHALVNQLNGTVTLTSALGVGTKVEIKLPELSTECQPGTSSSFGNELLFTVDEEF
jgi:signal transduction histidine kinase